MKSYLFPNQQTELLISKVKACYDKRAKELQKIKSAVAAKKYQTKVRKKIKEVFGPIKKHNGLQQKELWRKDFGSYDVCGVAYEGAPQRWVSANLYLPKIMKKKMPAVLFIPGHFTGGKCAPLYMEACLRLVHAGFVVLNYDPINQGERKLYHNSQTEKNVNPTAGHNILGKLMRACGESLGALMLQDAMRGLDVLCSYSFVDQQKLGITGNSGGGTLSSYLWAMDKRVKAIATSCWQTSYLADLENDMPADNEQCMGKVIEFGLDKVDFLMARAGEPALLLGQTYDFFDARYLQKAYEELLKLHQQLGGDVKTCQLHFDQQHHSYSVANQEKMVAFFCQLWGQAYRKTAIPRAPSENELRVKGFKTGLDLKATLSSLVSKAKAKRKKDPLRKRVEEVLGVSDSKKFVPYYRQNHGEGRWVEGLDGKRKVTRFLVESQDGLFVPCRHVAIDAVSSFALEMEKEPIIYLPNLSSAGEITLPLLKKFDSFWSIDVRGLGEGLHIAEDPFHLYGMEYMHERMYHMLGLNLMGARLMDLLSVASLFKSEGAKTFTVIGNGQGGFLAQLLALFCPEVKSIYLLNTPESIESLVADQNCLWPDVNFPAGVLSAFDFPEIKKALGKRIKNKGDNHRIGSEFKNLKPPANL